MHLSIQLTSEYSLMNRDISISRHFPKRASEWTVKNGRTPKSAARSSSKKIQINLGGLQRELSLCISLCTLRSPWRRELSSIAADARLRYTQNPPGVYSSRVPDAPPVMIQWNQSEIHKLILPLAILYITTAIIRHNVADISTNVRRELHFRFFFLFTIVRWWWSIFESRKSLLY